MLRNTCPLPSLFTNVSLIFDTESLSVNSPNELVYDSALPGLTLNADLTLISLNHWFCTSPLIVILLSALTTCASNVTVILTVLSLFGVGVVPPVNEILLITGLLICVPLTSIPTLNFLAPWLVEGSPEFTVRLDSKVVITIDDTIFPLLPAILAFEATCINSSIWRVSIVIFCVPSNVNPFIVLAVCKAVAVLALPIKLPVTVASKLFVNSIPSLVDLTLKSLPAWVA